jgi:hypothetical protein
MMRETVLSAAPLLVLLGALVLILADLFSVGQVATGRSLLFGNYRLTLDDLEQFKAATRSDGLPGFVTSTAPALKAACAIPIIVHAVLVAWGAYVLNGIALHLSDTLETGRNMARRWRHIAVVLVSSTLLTGFANSAVQAYIASQTSNAESRTRLLGGEYSVVQLTGATWPWVLSILAVIALAMAYRLTDGIEPEPRSPLQFPARGAALTDRESKGDERAAS